jgi:GNAT-family acetyltransferase (TIGR03103 family)
LVARHYRIERDRAPSIQSWKRPSEREAEQFRSDVVVDCGWGRLIFAHTFSDNIKLAHTLCGEKPGQRDIAMYLGDPHVVISIAPQELFLDPSHTFRLWLDRYQPSASSTNGFITRKLLSLDDAKLMNDIYSKRHMVTLDPTFAWAQRNSRVLTYAVAEDCVSGRIIGTVTGIDHAAAFDDPENGSSLWCLAVDPQATQPGVGEAMVRFLAEHYQARGRAFMDLSVMHDNRQAIALYEKLGFVRVPVFALKHKNPINEPLFIAPAPEAKLNPYAAIIVNEARRRGIAVEVLDEEQNYFSLSFGGRTVLCRESLSELTTAVAMSMCDDKRVTSRLLAKAGLHVPQQRVAASQQENEVFLAEQRRIVVKPARGEQGAGVSVDIREPKALALAIERAQAVDAEVILEQLVEGKDLRIIVIDYEVVAAAVRKPAQIIGTGRHTVAKLIEKQSRRRSAATGGESRIPLDQETRRCVAAAGYSMDAILPEGEALTVRTTANLHTGGTIHDVTARVHPVLRQAAIEAARVINIPVVGLDLVVPRVDGEEYAIIEANERPGLANHEPQPTAERFVDLLFPQTVQQR